jgi:hypothetical protein
MILALSGSARHGYRGTHPVAHRGGEATLVSQIDPEHAAAREGNHVLGLRHGAGQARPVHLDHEGAVFDVEGEATTVSDLAEPARVDPGGDVLENELRPDGFTTRGQCHGANIPAVMPPGGPDA